MSNTQSMPKVYTIGYEQHPTPQSLITSLKQAGIARVVDVRELPLSRRPGFSKARLAAALKDAGIKYEHVRALGNPKAFRDLYKSGRLEEGRNAFHTHLNNGASGALTELADSLDERPTCLLCFEAIQEMCHRAVIVSALKRQMPRLAVVHLD